MLLHHFEQVHRPNDVVLVVHDRLVHGKTDAFFTGEVHNTIDGSPLFFLLSEEFIKSIKIKNVQLMYLES